MAGTMQPLQMSKSINSRPAMMENRKSFMLDEEENSIIISLLGRKCLVSFVGTFLKCIFQFFFIFLDALYRRCSTVGYVASTTHQMEPQMHRCGVLCER